MLNSCRWPSPMPGHNEGHKLAAALMAKRGAYLRLDATVRTQLICDICDLLSVVVADVEAKGDELSRYFHEHDHSALRATDDVEGFGGYVRKV